MEMLSGLESHPKTFAAEGAGNRDSNGSGSGRVDRKLNPRKNEVELNLTPEPTPVGEN
jgi:hypothetical protein